MTIDHTNGSYPSNPAASAHPTAPPVTHLVVTPTKSAGIAILLTIVFGPLGLFYATVKGALTLLVGALVAAIALAVAGFSGDGRMLIGLPLLAFATWIAAFVWGIVAVNAYNARLMARGR